MVFWIAIVAGGVAINLAFLERQPWYAILAGVLYALAIWRYK